MFESTHWQHIILDEAQKIKNSGTATHQASLNLEADNKLVLSGTPMENSLKELWSLLNFVQRGLLGELKSFEKDFCSQILKGGYIGADEAERATAKRLINELRSRIKNHILRRTRRQLNDDCRLP